MGNNTYFWIVILILLAFLSNLSPKRKKKKTKRKQNKNLKVVTPSQQKQSTDGGYDWNPDWKWNPETNLWEHVSQSEKGDDSSIDYSKAYFRSPILTQHEFQEYKKLRCFADQRKLLICPKVRLVDLVTPKKTKGFYTAFNKVQSKHVDFVLADENMNVVGILELDDSSHDAPDRIERDQFVDLVLTSVGYKVLHTREITEHTLDTLLGVVHSNKPH